MWTPGKMQIKGFKYCLPSATTKPERSQTPLAKFTEPMSQIRNATPFALPQLWIKSLSWLTATASTIIEKSWLKGLPPYTCIIFGWDSAGSQCDKHKGWDKIQLWSKNVLSKPKQVQYLWIFSRIVLVLWCIIACLPQHGKSGIIVFYIWWQINDPRLNDYWILSMLIVSRVVAYHC